MLRRADLLDLFDTSSDLGGNQIDISRFVRSDQERDVYVLWREWDIKEEPPSEPEVDEGELCPAPIGDLIEGASLGLELAGGQVGTAGSDLPGDDASDALLGGAVHGGVWLVSGQQGTGCTG